MKDKEWEKITFSTFRMEVPNGWLIKHEDSEATSLCFVPDQHHMWKNDKTEALAPTPKVRVRGIM